MRVPDGGTGARPGDHVTAHARTVRLTDLPVLALHNRRVYANQAITHTAFSDPGRTRPNARRLLTCALVRPPGQRIWLSRDGATLLGLAAVRRRSARDVWEIDTLILPVPETAYVLDLLDRAVASAGADGAHRLFLRVPEDGVVLEAALRHGFIQVRNEVRYSVTGPCRGADAPAGTRRRARSDDLALFRIFQAAVPQEVRWHVALSPAEWSAAQEPLGPHSAEWIIPGPEGPAALIRLCRTGSGTAATLLCAGLPADTRTAVATARAHAGAPGPFHLLAPEHQTSVAAAAETMGMAASARYVLLVRPIAQRARRLQLAEHAVDGAARQITH